jgi:hypothetical protein
MLKNPLRIVITIAVPGDGEQVLTVIGDDEDTMQNWQLRTDDYTAQNRDRIIADTTAGAWELKLPPGARYGEEIEVLIDGTNALTLNPNGAKLNGAADNLPITSDRAKLAIVYKDSARGWIVGTGSSGGNTGGGGGTEEPPADPNAEATAVITAIEGTGVTLSTAQKTACIDRIAAMKSDGVWAKTIAYYGLLGGNALAHKINWKNPESYLVAWNGTLTHSANGVKGDGSTGWGNTGINLNTALASVGGGVNSLSLAVYLRTDESTVGCDIGSAGEDNAYFFAVSSGDKPLSGLNSVYNSNYETPFTSAGILGLHTTTRIGASAVLYYKNDGSAQVAPVPSTQVTTIPIALLARNLGNEVANFSPRQACSFLIAAGLTAQQVADNYDSEQAYQTALNRAV